jgi:hypothetical protein
MAIEKIINVIVKEKGTDLTIAKTDKLKGKLSQLNQTTGSLTKGLGESSNAILENGGAMGLLNELTGGLAMTVKDAVEATGLFTSGTTIATLAQKAYTFVVGTTTGALKALRLAIASTGIGLLVVAIGYLVSSMMSAGDATEEETRAQEALNKALENGKKAFDDLNEGIDYSTKLSILRAKIAGASEEELSNIEVKANEKRRLGYLARQKELEDSLYDEAKTPEQIEKIKAEISKNDNDYHKGLRQNEVQTYEDKLKVADEDRAKTAEANQKRLDAQKDYRERQRKLKEEQDKIDAEREEANRKALNEFQIAVNNAEFDERQYKLDEKQRVADALNKISVDQTKSDEVEAKKREQIAKSGEEAVAEIKINAVTNTQNLLLAIAKKGSAVAKGIAIADIVREQIKSASASIANLTLANAKAAAASPLTAGQPFVAINTISTIAGIAASAIGAGKAIKGILSDSKSVDGGVSAPSSGGGGGSATPSAPSFNVVGGTNSNQIAESLGGQNRPIQAFVVSSSVTSGQELDRNAQNRASI